MMQPYMRRLSSRLPSPILHAGCLEIIEFHAPQLHAETRPQVSPHKPLHTHLHHQKFSAHSSAGFLHDPQNTKFQ